MAGACCFANLNTSLTSLEPSPMYFYTNSEPDILIKAHLEWCATALANIVFPVPGLPYNKTPLGYYIPVVSYSSGCLIGISITSLISSIYFSSPPISS